MDDFKPLNQDVIRDAMKIAAVRLEVLERKKQQKVDLDQEIIEVYRQLTDDVTTIKKAMQEAGLPMVVVGQLMADSNYRRPDTFFYKVRNIPVDAPKPAATYNGGHCNWCGANTERMATENRCGDCGAWDPGNV